MKNHWTYLLLVSATVNACFSETQLVWKTILPNRNRFSSRGSWILTRQSRETLYMCTLAFPNKWGMTTNETSPVTWHSLPLGSSCSKETCFIGLSSLANPFLKQNCFPATVNSTSSLTSLSCWSHSIYLTVPWITISQGAGVLHYCNLSDGINQWAKSLK